MSESKRDLVESVVRRHVMDACAHVALNHPDIARTMSEMANRLAGDVSYRLCWQPYNWMQLCDIMAWRRRKVNRGD